MYWLQEYARYEWHKKLFVMFMNSRCFFASSFSAKLSTINVFLTDIQLLVGNTL
jgi:hypothetical protein